MSGRGPRLRSALGRTAIDVSPLRLSRPFRIVFTARTLSVFGLGFALVALPLQVYSLTGSSALVALVSAVGGMSVLGGTLVAGVLADRHPRRTLIVTGRFAATVAFTGLALNALWPDTPATLWIIAACAALNGFLGTFSQVALQAAVPGLIPRDRLPAAGALLALTGKLGGIAAPAAGGALIAAWGYPAVYAITAVASAATTALVARLPEMRPENGADGLRSPLAAIGDGLRFAVRDRTVGPVLLLGFVQLLFAAPHVLIPEIADRVLGGGEQTAGLLYSASAVGAVTASLTSGWTGSLQRRGAVLLGAVALCGAATAGLGAGTALAAAALALAALGFAEIIEEILRFALLQTSTPDAMRGRVNSLWTAQNSVGGSLGGLVLGGLAAAAGPGIALLAGGAAAAALTAAVAAAFPGLRRSREPAVPPPRAPAPEEQAAASPEQKKENA
ncbi:enterobactin transporter EntS [Nocardiopsis composta]|uniref:ENTS family enterobactin (Siderophore) exporter n=1 Tax=Nocardiopsis composta TaxID=157465 RepID=A0A7W8QKW1_9ACTN|nr:enterobactin transporter EntS [Nocardiopsis composta]MBB5431655.1 ENTS family enterobactin (siderophore) exporter [Nocardiopsis composta]